MENACKSESDVLYSTVYTPSLYGVKLKNGCCLLLSCQRNRNEFHNWCQKEKLARHVSINLNEKLEGS